MFAGTPDAIFENAIIDWKRQPGNSKIHALQISAQHLLALKDKIIKPCKKWLVVWYDKESGKFKSRNVYNDIAEQIFIGIVKKYYIDLSVENYLKGV